jgi:hypothetical protein
MVVERQSSMQSGSGGGSLWRPTEALVGDEGLVSFLVDRDGFIKSLIES